MSDYSPMIAFFERQKPYYPTVLGYQSDIFVASRIAKPFAVQRPPYDLSPADAVCKHILFGSWTALDVQMCYRNEQNINIFGSEEEELQGYIDAIALNASACYASSNDTPIESMILGTRDIPGWGTLPEEVIDKAAKFVAKHERWALSEIVENDLYYGGNLMNKVVQRISDDPSVNRTYAKGVKTARDTFLLYVEFILAFLKGEFYTGQ